MGSPWVGNGVSSRLSTGCLQHLDGYWADLNVGLEHLSRALILVAPRADVSRAVVALYVFSEFVFRGEHLIAFRYRAVVGDGFALRLAVAVHQVIV